MSTKFNWLMELVCACAVASVEVEKQINTNKYEKINILIVMSLQGNKVTRILCVSENYICNGWCYIVY